MKNNNEDQVLLEIQKITKLLLLMVTKGQSQTDQIETLYKVGFQPKEIATFLGTTANTVRVTLSKSRKKK